MRRLPRPGRTPGTKGAQGPNLDLAFKKSIEDGLGRSTIEGVVKEQIKLPQGGVMPAKLVTGDDADAVAAYVADAIGKKGGRRPAAGRPERPRRTPRTSSTSRPTRPASSPTSSRARPRRPARSRSSRRTTPRSRTTSRCKGGPSGQVVQGGGDSKFTANLKPGSYTFYCTVPGHEQAGMKGTLTVK